ncbi:MAG TPA: competence protein ComFB [Spirochaetaceae bacterium]|nr:competence protein ComFB [Spirochaetaceae bacterium]
MDIRNLMEDYVKATVHELFDAEQKGSTSSWCTCDQCRLDVACYVLNRLKPEYVISGRGVAYSEQDYQEKLQKTADVVSLVREAWAKINSSPRPYHSHGAKHVEQQQASGPVYNLPPIMGRLFNGNNFEPIAAGTIELHSDEGLVAMIDANWQNPYPMVKNTAGTFIFWPAPVAAVSGGEKKRFSFTITASLGGFDALSHFLELELPADAEAVRSFSLAKVHKLPDLYVFPA